MPVNMVKNPKISKEVRRDILCEMGYENCRIADLMGGCYGNYAYMEQSYNVSRKAIDECAKEIEELPEFIKAEHDVEVTTREIISIMREGWRELEELWSDKVIGY